MGFGDASIRDGEWRSYGGTSLRYMAKKYVLMTAGKKREMAKTESFPL